MRKILLLFTALSIFTSFINAQPFATWSVTEFKLNNGSVLRTITLPQGNATIATTSYKPVQGDLNC